MKRFFCLTLIATLPLACVTAHAEDPTPDLPDVPKPLPPETPQILVPKQQWAAIVQYLQASNIKWADQCVNEATIWFCNASYILKQLNAKPYKPKTCPEKTE